jgi:hypothetical protein
MRPLLVASALALATAPIASTDAQPADVDRAARGIDVFLHVPGDAAPGSLLPVQIEAFGFPTTVALAPLGDATVEAGWDPEHLGTGVTAAPAAVRGRTDASGRAKLLVPVPDGEELPLRLLVHVRSGNHERARWATVHRGALHAVSVYVADTEVVPGR